MRATARRVCDACLWEHRLERAQNLLNYRHILGDELVNRTYGSLEDIWDEPYPQNYCEFTFVV